MLRLAEFRCITMEPKGTRYTFDGEAIGLPELAHGQLKASLVVSVGWFFHVTIVGMDFQVLSTVLGL